MSNKRLMLWIWIVCVSLLLAGCVSPVAPAGLPTPTPEVFIPRTAVAPAGPVIAGRVLWGSAPVAGARVELRTGAWADLNASEVIAQTVAGADGNYTLEAPPNGGEFGLVAVWPDGSANPSPVTPVQVTAGDGRIAADVFLAQELEWLEPFSGEEVGNTPTLRWSGLSGVAQYQVWIVDTGTTELVFDLNITENTAAEQSIVLPPLTPDRTYTLDVQGLAADGALLARRTGEFRVVAQAAGSSGAMPPISSDLAYTRVEIAEAGLDVEIPAGWLRLEPDWVWTPSEDSELRLGVKWAALQPPQEIEAAMLPASAVVLSSQPVTADWGDGRWFTVAVYGTGNQVQTVEAHILFVLEKDGTRRALDLYASAPDEAQLQAQQAILQRMMAAGR
jgi:hypothetical protein